MGYDNRLSIRTLNHRSHDISQIEVDLRQRMILTPIIHDKLMQSTRLSSHSG